MSSILILPIIELILVGALAGVVGVLAVLGKQVFFAEAITHATFPGAVVGVVIAAALGLSHSWISVFLFIGAFLMCIPIGALFGLSGGNNVLGGGNCADIWVRTGLLPEQVVRPVAGEG